MHKKCRNKIIILTFILIIFLGRSYSALAGTGNIIDFDSDFGGGGSSWDSGGSYGGGGSGSWLFFSDDWGFEVVIIIVFFIIYVAYTSRNKNKSQGRPTHSPVNQRNYPDQTSDISDKIKVNDEDFSSKVFVSWVKEVYTTLDEAFSSLDWDKVRPFESNEMFQTHKKQVDEYIEKNTRPQTERLFINEVYFTDYQVDEKFEYLTVLIDSRFQHYIVNSNTKEVIQGDKDRVYYVKVLYEFKRTMGTKTNIDGKGFTTTNCPNCGGTLDITSSGKCEWCGSVITTGEYGWVLNNIVKVSQTS